MKSEKGITLAALVIYVLIFSITIVLLASLSNYIFQNLNKISAEEISSEEFNKFNVYFIKDVKESRIANVKAGQSDEVIITLESGSTYTYKDDENAIYKNKEKIAINIVSFTAETKVENNKNIIDVTIKTGKDPLNPKFSKNIKYVLKYW